MIENENPAGQGGASNETAERAVSGVQHTPPGIGNATASPASSASSRTWAVNPDPTRSHNGKKFGKQTAILAAEATEDYLASDRLPKLKGLPPKMVSNGLLDEINRRILTQNRAVLGYKDADGTRVEPTMSGVKLSPLTTLPIPQLAWLMTKLHSVILLTPQQNSDPDLDGPAVYDDDPGSPTYGTYLASLDGLRALALQYQPDLSTRGFTELLAALRDKAPRRSRGTNKDLVPCRNGIVNYNAGKPTFMEFSPEHIFVSKLATNWNPDAENPVIPNPEGCCQGHDDPALCSDKCLTWDVESWMKELSDDEGVSELLWETTGATVRPYVSWNQSAYFYGTRGNNGKGTLLHMNRNLLGVQNYANIPLSDFGKDFMLEPLTRASAILVDENDVGTFLEKSATLKAVVTNDVITINRKYKAPIAHQHWGFMIQCLNDRPAIKDKSESFYRRQVFIPFNKSFTGAERKYIKDDYLARQDVLEYVLKRVLTMNYYSLSQPPAVKDALNEFKNNNDPIRAFWHDTHSKFTWDLLPYKFVFALYKRWMVENMANSKPVGRNKFYEAIRDLVESDPTSKWEAVKDQRPGTYMDAPEMLIAEYEVVDWSHPSYDRLRDPVKYSTFLASRQASAYDGLIRKAPAQIAAARTEQMAEMMTQAGLTLSPLQPEASAAADATASPTSDPFTGPPAPGWGGEGITPPVGTAGGPAGSHTPRPDGVDPVHIMGRRSAAFASEGDNR